MSDKSSVPGFRVGIVGTGGIARHHGRACAELENVNLVAICDVSEKALNDYGKMFQIGRRYLNLDEMLEDEQLDVAIIANWGVHHAETGIQIAKSRKVRAILCEKPFTSTAAEALQLVTVAKSNGVLIAEGFKFRHHPMHLKTKELIEAGTVGKIMTVRSTFCTGTAHRTRSPESNWRYNKAKGGGSIFDLGCYCIHHARFVFDSEPSSVFAIQQLGIEVDDAMFITLGFPGARVAQICVGFNFAITQQYAEICGTEGMLRLDRVWNNEDRPVAIKLQTGSGEETIAFPPVYQFANQLEHLCECLASGAQHRIRPENSISQMKVIDAIFESIATGNVVKLTGL